MVRGAWLAALVLLSACASAPPRSVEIATPLLLVSLDGVRPDYLHRGLTPTLSRVAQEGVQAEWMAPSYPSLTFPNHYTLVTGLRPDRHGIINNTMQDEELGDFTTSDRKAVGNGRWWSAEPIWVTAEKAGLRTATLFWPGSEAPVQGVRPWRWREFDKDLAPEQRVDQVLEWLALPPAKRPQLLTLYFEHVDTAGHDAGPDSQHVDQTLRDIDAALDRLLSGLRARGQLDRVNLVVVSDHGMAATSPQRAMAVEDMVSPDDARAITTGQVAGFAPRPGREANAERQLLRDHGHAQCWRKRELPPRWHYGSHPRIPAIICQADEGWLIVRRATQQRWAEKGWQGGGSHGYDPALPSMRAIFMARGPAFRRGARLPGFDNVDVYPLLTRLLGIAAVPHDGNPQTLLPALNDGSARDH